MSFLPVIVSFLILNYLELIQEANIIMEPVIEKKITQPISTTLCIKYITCFVYKH